MSILGVEFEPLGDCSQVDSEASTLQDDNVEHFTLADFEHYCSQTDVDSKEKSAAVTSENNEKESCENTELFNVQELPERLDDEELTPTWLDNTEQERNNSTASALSLSPSLYANDRQASFRTETDNEKDKFKDMYSDDTVTLEDTKKNNFKKASVTWTTTTSWTNNQATDVHVSSSTSPYRFIGDSGFSRNEQQLSNFQEMENNDTEVIGVRPIPTSWIETHADYDIHSFTENASVPAPVYPSAPPQIHVEVGNDGQQYMIMDGKYFTDNIQDMAPFQVGGNNTYYLSGMQLNQFAEYPPNSRASDSQSTSNNSSCSQQDTSGINPLHAFQSYAEDDTPIDKDVLEEQKRKELMQKRRREKNKDCSRAFRRKQKDKERSLREGRSEKHGWLKELNRKNENLIRILSKVAIQGCDKAKSIAATGMESWNKENKSEYFFTGNI